MSHYRVSLDFPVHLLLKVSNMLKQHREEIGTRNGTRALTCWQQAKFILAWFRDKPDPAASARASGSAGHRLPVQGRGRRGPGRAGTHPAGSPGKGR